MSPKEWAAGCLQVVGADSPSRRLRAKGASEMRAIHFRVEDDLYLRIQEEAEQQDLSVASFARVATIARALLWGVRRGAPWADVEAWGEALDIIQEVEHRDISARRKLAADRRESRTFSEELHHERQHAARDPS
jgi:hypothetical protein